MKECFLYVFFCFSVLFWNKKYKNLTYSSNNKFRTVRSDIRTFIRTECRLTVTLGTNDWSRNTRHATVCRATTLLSNCACLNPLMRLSRHLC